MRIPTTGNDEKATLQEKYHTHVMYHNNQDLAKISERFFSKC